MAQSLDQVASVVEALQRRVEALEAALKHTELPLGGGPPAPVPHSRTSSHIDIDIRLAQMGAINDYYRREGLQQMATQPELLAAVRARRAKVNAYLEERGLPPEPDPYHELP